MTAKKQDIDDIFTMFHDFEVARLDLQGGVLTMEIILPWGYMWNNYDYRMTFKFFGCDSLCCIYHKRIDNVAEPVTIHHPTEELETTDTIVIEGLRLDVQRHKFEEPDKYILYCNSMADDVDGAHLLLSAIDYKIYDNAGEEMTLDKMKEWATEWWDGIQRMWDEQKNK